MIRIYLILFVGLVLLGCYREPIDLDLNEAHPKLIISAWLTNAAEPQYVTVSRSSNYLGPLTIDYVGGAEVILSDQNSSYFLEEKEVGRHFLPHDWKIHFGQEYTLQVIFENEMYTASSLARPAPEFIAINYKDGSESYDSIQYFETIISFRDTPGEGDGYFYLASQKNVNVHNKIDKGFLRDDALVDGIVFSDVVATNYEDRHQIGDTVVVELHSIGQDALDYFNDIISESFRGEDPFAPPPVNVRTNLTGGALGYFLVSGMQKAEIIIE